MNARPSWRDLDGDGRVIPPQPVKFWPLGWVNAPVLPKTSFCVRGEPFCTSTALLPPHHVWNHDYMGWYRKIDLAARETTSAAFADMRWNQGFARIEPRPKSSFEDISRENV